MRTSTSVNLPQGLLEEGRGDGAGQRPRRSMAEGDGGEGDGLCSGEFPVTVMTHCA